MPELEDYTMSVFDAAMIAEGAWDMTDYEPTEEMYFAALQTLIDTGTAWTLQGSIGRACMAAIDAGFCMDAG